MTSTLDRRAGFGALARIAVAFALALSLPNLIVAAAPPAPGDTAFLVWF